MDRPLHRWLCIYVCMCVCVCVHGGIMSFKVIEVLDSAHEMSFSSLAAILT